MAAVLDHKSYGNHLWKPHHETLKELSQISTNRTPLNAKEDQALLKVLLWPIREIITTTRRPDSLVKAAHHKICLSKGWLSCIAMSPLKQNFFGSVAMLEAAGTG